MPALTYIVQPPEYIVVHHSASPRSTKLEEIRSWHKQRGFDDIGYHWVIEEGGKIRAARPYPRVGAHVKGKNARSIGVCVTGNNLEPQERWYMDQVASLVKLIDAFELLYPGIKIVGHRELAPTECPGVDIRALLGRDGPEVRVT